MSKEERFINWPAAVAICVGACAFAFALWASCADKGEYYKSQVEINKARIEYDKWLIEKGIITEPRLR